VVDTSGEIALLSGALIRFQKAGQYSGSGKQGELGVGVPGAELPGLHISEERESGKALELKGRRTALEFRGELTRWTRA